MKSALIIFLKYPELGRSKTRLAKDIGNENALKVYIELLNHTQLISKQLKIDKYLFYDKVTANKMLWGDEIYQTAYQIESDLGGRMENAFEQLFLKGYDRVVIIGSDCYELTQDVIEQAFELLNTSDAVVGPAKDGGYYLLGLRKLIPQLFSDVAWSTDEVFSATVKTLENLNLTYSTTPILSDIDTIEDLTPKLKLLIS